MSLASDRDDRLPGRMAIASRLRSIREEILGEDGVAELAGALGLPPRTWLNYEVGVVIPGDVLLRYLELTGIEPGWLLRGAGPRFRVEASGPPTAPGPG